MKKKRLLGILLSITLILGLTPGICMTVRADDSPYGLYVGGVAVTGSNKTDVLGDGKVSFTPGSGGNDAILALSGATISYNSDSNSAIEYRDGASANLTIVLSGANTIRNSSGRGIHSKNHNITVKGDGSLYVNARNNKGIYTETCSLKVEDVTVTSEEEGDIGFGIQSDRDIEIEKGIVKAYGRTSGIYSQGIITVNNGTVEAIGTGNSNPKGIDALSGIEIKRNSSVTASGAYYAIKGSVINSIEGTGWENADGTGTVSEIAESTSGQTLDYKKVQFPRPPATVTTKPTAKSLTYTGEAQDLVTAGDAEHGTMQYALGTVTEATEAYTGSIPKRTNAGDYYVWYKAKGNTGYVSTTPASVKVTINEPAPTPPTPIPPIPVKPYAVVKKAPEVTSLIYNGQPQELVAKGEAIGGTMEYAIGMDATTAPTDGWSTEIPTGIDAGTYHIWYRVVADKNHKDVAPLYAGATTIEGKHSDNVISIDEEKGTAIVKDDVSGGTSEVPIEVITEGPIYRMYDPNRGEHIYTKKWADVEALLEWGWIHENDSDFTVVNAMDEDAVPVYRLYNPNFGGMHYYTDNAEDAKYLASVGCNYEGISHYVYKASSTKGTPQYRLYNPNSPSGEHIWLSDESGINMLIEAGWIYEGICWRIA